MARKEIFAWSSGAKTCKQDAYCERPVSRQCTATDELRGDSDCAGKSDGGSNRKKSARDRNDDLENVAASANAVV